KLPISPSPPSGGGEGWGEEAHFCWFPLPMKHNGGRASRLPPVGAADGTTSLARRRKWAGETPALRWRRRDSRAHGAPVFVSFVEKTLDTGRCSSFMEANPRDYESNPSSNSYGPPE